MFQRVILPKTLFSITFGKCRFINTNAFHSKNRLWLKMYFPRRFHLRNTSTDQAIIMKLKSPEFYSIFTPELRKLASIFDKYGYEIRIVGGAVRDLLKGEKPHDLDFASSATPDQMIEMFETEQVRMINNKGEKHGTITPRINNKQNFEVTTLRTDVSTDGRHAEVEFTTDWKKDAARRDLTINSMYLGLDGSVYDYFNGYEDLKNRKVIFVGDPDLRIKEDYLRILRYFRFYGKISRDGKNHDESTLRAIQENASGLSRISGERVWVELSRILSGNFIEEIVTKMLDLGLGPFIGLDNYEKLDMKCFQDVCHRNSQFNFRPVTFIAALMPTEEKVLSFHSRVRLSTDERDLAQMLVNCKREEMFEPYENRLTPYWYLAVCGNMDVEHVLELMKFKNENQLIEEFLSRPIRDFPIDKQMLKFSGVKDIKKIESTLSEMKKEWVDSDFQLSGKDLLKRHKLCQ